MNVWVPQAWRTYFSSCCVTRISEVRWPGTDSQWHQESRGRLEPSRFRLTAECTIETPALCLFRMRMYTEGLLTAATPPQGLQASQSARCAAKPWITWRQGWCLVHLAHWKPKRWGSKIPYGLDLRWPSITSETYISHTWSTHDTLPVLCSQSPRESAWYLPQPGPGKLLLPSVPLLSHCWGFWVVGFSVRLLPFTRFLEALDLGRWELLSIQATWDTEVTKWRLRNKVLAGCWSWPSKKEQSNIKSACGL
jgi:hypothetical protein